MFSGEIACEFRHGAVVEILENSVLDSAWDDDSECRCVACRWSGRVEAVRGEAAVAVATAAEPAVDLASLERDTVTGNCPTGLQRPVRQVLDAVQQLKNQLRILETLERAQSRRRRNVDSSDTAIL